MKSKLSDSVVSAMSLSYSSNLTPAKGELIANLMPAAKPGGRPRSVNKQAVTNAMLYILGEGCAWHRLLSDFPCGKTV